MQPVEPLAAVVVVVLVAVVAVADLNGSQLKSRTPLGVENLGGAQKASDQYGHLWKKIGLQHGLGSCRVFSVSLN